MKLKIFCIVSLIIMTSILYCKADVKNKIIHSYPKSGVYYCYDSNFNPLYFKQPKEINSDNYVMFVYDKDYSANDFKKSDSEQEIIDESGYMFSMYIVGIKKKPKFFVHKHNNCLNSFQDKCIDICEFKKNSNTQIKYTIHPWTGKIIKQMEFDNGPIGLGNICNPDWIPETDI